MSQGPTPATPQKRPAQVNRRWALVALVAVVVLLVGAVGVYAFLPKAAPSSSASPGDLSPYDQIRAQIGPNGEVTKEMALEAFSLAIAPLPGVTVPTGAPPNLDEQGDATFAVLWILPYLDQLTPEQRAVIQPFLTDDPNAPSITPQPAAGLAPNVVLAADMTGSDYLDLAEKYESQIAAELGRALTTKVTMTIDSTQLTEHDEWLAYSVPVNADSSVCAIHVEPLLQSGNDAAQMNATMAHEMFHCFQFDWARQHGFQLSKQNMPDWITEGQAEWVGETLGGPSKTGDHWWKEYLTTYRNSLFTRDYDAIGFYQHLAEEGINPWQHFDAMLDAYTNGSNGNAFVAASANEDTFLDTWASGIFEDQDLGPDWDATSPWQQVTTTKKTVTVGGPGNDYEDAGEVANELVEVNVTADILEVNGTGHVRLHLDGLPEMPNDVRWICFAQNSCECPPGKTYQGPAPLEDVGGGLRQVDFALTGGLDGAQLSLIGHSLDDYCKAPPSQPPPCQSNCGNSNGDPHLRTTNRYRYDFQAAGEFVLLRNADSSIEIQARQEAYTHSTYFKGVSTNTAVAMRDNGHKVSVYATGSGLELHVDGQAANPDAPPDLGDGAAIKRVNNGLEIDFPDGSSVTALSVGQWGINAIVNASPSLLASGVGLLGPITPGNMGVPALPDGTQLPAAPDTRTRDSILYGQFADAWRVTDQTTLFDYDAGKSTESYTDRNFPSDADRQALEAALASPDPTQQAAAQSACSAITDPDLKDECEYDVFATGDSGFAQGYAGEQDLYDSGVVTPSGPPSLPPPSGPTMNGATRVLDAAYVAGSAIGPDDTVYLSYDDAAGASHLVAIDSHTATVKTTVDMRKSTDIHFVDGSIWASGQHLDANSQDCNVTRYDPTTLAEQATFNIPCSSGYPGPQLESTGDAAWFIDTSKVDPNTGAGAQLTRIDPSTNAPSQSATIPSLDGCCQSSQGALYCFCGNDDVWRLLSAGNAFEDLGNYLDYIPAGTGFWTELQDGSGTAGYVDGPGGPSATVPLNNGSLVAGEANYAYIQGDTTGGLDTGYPLLRQATDGSAPVQLATSPVWDAEDLLNMSTLDYLTGNPIKFATSDGLVTIWGFQGAEWLQWAPLP